MQQQLHRALRLGAIAGALALMSGCATVTPEQLSAVESKASSALSEARSAGSTANEALNMAKQAAGAAEAARQAQSTADAAMACCNENKDRIERMFEQSMRK